jgi:hypothetical protein
MKYKSFIEKYLRYFCEQEPTHSLSEFKDFVVEKVLSNIEMETKILFAKDGMKSFTENDKISYTMFKELSSKVVLSFDSTNKELY